VHVADCVQLGLILSGVWFTVIYTCIDCSERGAVVLLSYTERSLYAGHPQLDVHSEVRAFQFWSVFTAVSLRVHSSYSLHAHFVYIH